MIKAVIFDADGVVVNGGHFSEQYAQKHGIPHEIMLPFFKGEFQKCLVGKLDFRKAVKPYLSQWKWQGTAEEFLNYWFQLRNHLDEKLVKKAKQLREKSIKCLIASNQEVNRSKFLENEMKFSEIFDRTYYSAAIGYKKPQKEFWKYLQKDLDKEGIRKEDVLFWDDKTENVNSAREFGWNAELYKNYEEFSEKTNKHFSRFNI